MVHNMQPVHDILLVPHFNHSSPDPLLKILKYSMVYYGIYSLLVLSKSAILENFGFLARKMTIYGRLKYLAFGLIWYDMVC